MVCSSWKVRNEKLHEGTETTEPGRYHRRNFSCIVRDQWILFRSISKGKISRISFIMTAHSWKNPGADLWMYRLSGTGYADRSQSGRIYTWTKRSCASCNVQEKRQMSWKRNVRTLFTEMKKRVPGCIANGIDEQTANKSMMR